MSRARRRQNHGDTAVLVPSLELARAWAHPGAFDVALVGYRLADGDGLRVI